MDYFGARYYGGAPGRFTSPYPIWVKADRMLDPQRLNQYAYGRNNPLRFSDPTGMDVAIGNCGAGMTTSMCEAAITNGLTEDDRSHVHFVKGDDKNGFAAGQWGVQVDQDYKSNSGNFQALQNAAGDHSALAVFNFEPTGFTPPAQFAVSNGKGGLNLVSFAGEWQRQTGSKFPGLTPVGGNGIQGLTAAQLWGGAIEGGTYSCGTYSYGHNTQIYAVSDTALDMTINFFHELQHVVLGDFGRNIKASWHDEPGVNQKIGAAQEEAKRNAGQQ